MNHNPNKEDRHWAQKLVESGDERAFRELYGRHSPRLYGFVMRLMGTRASAKADAEDIVQETWVRATARLKDFRWQSTLTTWLCGIAQNLCRERLRKQKTRDEKQAVMPAPETLTPGPGGLRIDLEKAISRLPTGYRTVLVLHDLEGWTHREIARDLGISDGTSKSQLFEARKQVRTWLEGAQHASTG